MITENDYQDRKTITAKLIAEFGEVRRHEYTDKYGDSFVTMSVGLVEEKNGKKVVTTGCVFGSTFIEGFYNEDKERFEPAVDFGGRVICSVGESTQGKYDTSTFFVERQ